MTTTLIGSPTILLQRASDDSSPSLRRVTLTCEAGTNPRSKPIGTINPPLLYPITEPSNDEPEAFIFSASIQSFSSRARIYDRTKLPLGSSGLMTYTGISWPIWKLANVSAGICSFSFPDITPSDLVPTLTRISFSPMLAMTPVRISPCFGKSRFRPSSCKSFSIVPVFVDGRSSVFFAFICPSGASSCPIWAFV